MQVSACRLPSANGRRSALAWTRAAAGADRPASREIGGGQVRPHQLRLGKGAAEIGEETAGAAGEIEQREAALVARPPRPGEQRQRPAAHRRGRAGEQRLDLRLVAPGAFGGQPAAGLIVEVLPIVARVARARLRLLARLQAAAAAATRLHGPRIEQQIGGRR